MTACHHVIVAPDRDDLLDHAARAAQVGRNPRIVHYDDTLPIMTLFQWRALGRPVHGVKKVGLEPALDLGPVRHRGLAAGALDADRSRGQAEPDGVIERPALGLLLMIYAFFIVKLTRKKPTGKPILKIIVPEMGHQAQGQVLKNHFQGKN